MNGALAMLLDADLVSQLKSEWLHIAFLALYSGGAYILSRSLRLGDERVGKIEKQVESHSAELASHARQIRDTRAAVGCCETKLDIEHYPYTD